MQKNTHHSHWTGFAMNHHEFICLRGDDLLMDSFGSANADRIDLIDFSLWTKIAMAIMQSMNFCSYFSLSFFHFSWDIRGDFQKSSIVCSVPLQLQCTAAYTHGRSVWAILTLSCATSERRLGNCFAIAEICNDTIRKAFLACKQAQQQRRYKFDQSG